MKKNLSPTLSTLLAVPCAFAIALLLTSCGKPPAGQSGPPPGDWPANAVVAKAEVQTLNAEISLVASLAAKEMVSLVSEIDAKVLEVGFSEGQQVKKGASLFKLDQAVTGARLREANVAFDLAKKTYERNKQLLKNQTISQQEYDRAETEFYSAEAALTLAKDEHSKTVVYASFDGVIGEKEISAGQFVTRGQSLASLIQINPLQVVFEVPERHIGALKPELKVNFSAEAFPGETFTGKLIYTSPLVDEKSRTLRAKAEIPNPDRRLKPGMFGQLALVLSTTENALVIPEAAIQLMGQPTVVTVSPEGISGFQPVVVGQRLKGKAQILEGLKAGDMLVVEGYQKMGPGMKVIASAESEAYGVTPGPLFTPEEAVPGAEAAAGDTAPQGDEAPSPKAAE